MRREILTEFPSGIIDFENKNISIMQKQWKFRISIPMSYIGLGAALEFGRASNSVCRNRFLADLEFGIDRNVNYEKSMPINEISVD